MYIGKYVKCLQVNAIIVMEYDHTLKSLNERRIPMRSTGARWKIIG